MTIELSGKDLGIGNCEWSATGETPADVVEQVVKHLRKEHNIDMPAADMIMRGRVSENPLMSDADASVKLIVRRLYSELDLPVTDTPPEELPAARQVTGR